MGIKIVRMTVGQWGHTKAYFDVEIEGFGIIKGFKLVQGKTELFVGVPAIRGKDSEGEDCWKNIVVLTDERVSALYKEAVDLQGRGGLKPAPKGQEPKAVAGDDDDIPF